MEITRNSLIKLSVAILILLLLSGFVVYSYVDSNVSHLNEEIKKLNEELNNTNLDLVEAHENISTLIEQNEENLDLHRIQVKEMQNYISDLEGRLNRLSGLEVIPEQKTAYLTFDDGPGGYSHEILDILAEYDVKATFFVNGRESEDSHDVYRRIVDDGHALGNHTYSHKYSYIYTGVDNFMADLYKLEDILYDITGVRPRIIRFPGGTSAAHISSSRHKPYVNRVLSEGYQYFDWNIDSGDADATPRTSSQIVANVMRQIHYHNYANILMHETYPTMRALPSIIEQIRDLGYTFDVLSVDSHYVHHRTR
jgi:peptidoglycan/xylan/chitin deacetylase (PgdA/CDA1 family)